MNFFKQNSSIISKLFVMHIGTMIVSIVLATSLASNKTLLFYACLFCLFFNLFIIYNCTWEKGSSDIIKIEAGRMTKIKFYGLKTEFCASIVELLLVILLFVGWALVPSGATGLYTIIWLIIGLWQAPYLGFSNKIFTFTTIDNVSTYHIFNLTVNQMNYYLGICIFYLIALLPQLLVAQLGYYSGLKNFKLIKKERK